MNNKEEKLKKILFDIINKLSKDADVYHHTGSLWLIHTEDRKWIVEYTKERTLWFNYNFFRSAFKFVSLDINDKNEYVTEWFESRFLDKPKVEDTNLVMNNYSEDIVDAIENGVKETLDDQRISQISVENTIQNGVKHTRESLFHGEQLVKGTIENGVKHTEPLVQTTPDSVEDTIQNGVKHTKAYWYNPNQLVEDTIQNGVKHTSADEFPFLVQVEDTIQNGVKETKENWSESKYQVEDTIENGVKHTEIGWAQDNGVEDAIENGVKHTICSHQLYFSLVEGTIQNGVKDTKENRLLRTASVMNTILDGVKHVEDGVKEIKSDKGYLPHFGQQYKAKQTIQNGVKETLSTAGKPLRVEDTIQNGVKDTGYVFGNIINKVEDAIENGVKHIFPKSNPTTWTIENTIQNGVKETKRPLLPRTKRVEDAIENGVKKTYSTLRRTKLGVDDIIQNGVKDTKPMDEWVNAESIIEDTIEYGVKELQPLPAQDGNRDWGNYYRGKEDRTKPFNVYVDEAIIFGVKEVIKDNHHRTREVAVTIKDGVKETHQDCSNNIARVEGIIRVGEKLD